MIEGGVIKVDKATGKPIPGSKAALVYGQMNEPPGARARVALTGTTPHYVTLHYITLTIPFNSFPPAHTSLLILNNLTFLVCLTDSSIV